MIYPDETIETTAYVKEFSDGQTIIVRQMRRASNETAFRAYHVELTPEVAAFIGAKLLHLAVSEKGE